MGQLRVGVNRLQQAQGRPHAAAGRNAAPQGAAQADLEADLRPRQRADRKLVEVYQRDVLECPAGEVTESPTGPVVRDAHTARGPYTSVLLGEQAASKTAPRGSTPRARACRRGSKQKGACLVNRLMLVRIQSSALERMNPDGVADLHRTLRRSGPWFESRSGYLRSKSPRGCAG